jgi:signal transduction histidine kinase
MDVIIKGSMRLKAIVEDMSTISHKEEGQSRLRRELFSMTKMVIDTVGRFQESAVEKQIELGYDVPDSDPLMIEADRDKIDVALGNLVRNAIAFTDALGQV